MRESYTNKDKVERGEVERERDWGKESYIQR